MRSSRIARPRPTEEGGDVPVPDRPELLGRVSPALIAFGAAAALVVLAFVGS